MGPPLRPIVRHFPRPIALSAPPSCSASLSSSSLSSSSLSSSSSSSSSSPSSLSKIPHLLSISARPVASMTPAQRALFSSSARSRSSSSSADDHGAGHHHEESHYDPPGGWLWGVPPGEKYKNEGWEKVWVWGFWGSLGVAAVAYAYKPDTSIQTWALEEARRRLEAEGILPDPDTAGEPAKPE